MTKALRRRRYVKAEEGAPVLSGSRRRAALAELVRRGRSKKSVDLGKLSFPKQRALIEDPSPLIAVCCSRRAGKTWGIGFSLCETAKAHPWSTSLYLCNTRPQAKRNVWGVLQRLNAELELGAKFNAVELSMTFPNGAQVLLGGANDELEIERYRGPAYHLVVVDEAQSIRPFFEYMIDDIFEPATLDYRGRIMIAGTPNASCVGFFHDVMKAKKQGWSLHAWTLLENPNLVDPAGWLAERRRRKGISETDPKYRREYLGEWVRDTTSQAYQIGEKNKIPRFVEEDASDWEFVLGIDLGFKDLSAFCVTAFSIALGRVVVVESYQKVPSHFVAGELLLTPQMIAGEIRALGKRYDFAHIVVDPGGLGATYIEEFRRRFDIHSEAAEKKSKLAAIEMLNGDLRAGRVLVVEPANLDLIHDASVMEWDWSRVNVEGPVARADLVIDQRVPDHLTDALTYAYRRCRAYLHDPTEDDAPPVRGTAEHDAWEERERERRELAADSEARPWWEEQSYRIARAMRRLVEWGSPLATEAA